MKVLALFTQLIGFDQHRPCVGRKVIAQVARPRRKTMRLTRLGFLRHVSPIFMPHEKGRFVGPKTTLRLRSKLSYGFNLAAEKLQAVGRFRVRRENVKNAAPATELARHLD